MQNVFVYGTLMSVELLKKLTGKTFDTSRASLYHYKSYAVRGADYPALSAKKGAITHGLLLKNVDKQSMSVLEYYEGEEYKKTEVDVWSNDKKVKALVFVWNAEPGALEDKEWNFEYFCKNRLDDFLNFEEDYTEFFDRD
jgi:gamma-glutamylcyclotransferase (GGCT)/AIG2-like uncharacterized protein YtfP